VHSVRRESDDTVSVIVQGRSLDRLQVRGGQYFGFRFLVRGRWWESHPYSVSAVPTDRFLRVTIKDLGDDSGAAATLRPGTRVVAEGPFGVFTATERRTDHVVLIGGGVGITPLRAMLDDLPAHVRIDVLLRARTADDVLFRSELDAIAATPGRMRVHYRRLAPPVPRDRWRVAVVCRASNADVFACGSADLVEAVRASAHEHGIPAECLHDEAFTFHSPDTYAFERAERTTS
jgi:ferredoxin-NADP reductase